MFGLFDKNPASEAFNDQALIEGTLKGQLKCFDTLITQYRNRVFHFILKHIGDAPIAEDLAQDTFLSAYQKLSTFQGQSEFSTWLLGIALNKVRNYLSRAVEQRYNLVSDAILAAYPEEKQSPLEQAEQNQLLLAIQEALQTIPPDLKEVIILVSMEGLSYEEAAQLLKVPIGTLKSKLFRAREWIKQFIEKSQTRD